jgi:hypothetical protein
VGIKISREKTRPEKGRSLKSYLTSWLDASKQETLEKLYPQRWLITLTSNPSPRKGEGTGIPATNKEKWYQFCKVLQLLERLFQQTLPNNEKLSRLN